MEVNQLPLIMGKCDVCKDNHVKLNPRDDVFVCKRCFEQMQYDDYLSFDYE